MKPSSFLEHILSFLKRFIPKSFLGRLRPLYHFSLAFLGALIYRFPSKKITIIAVTGTKGKTSSVELVNALLEEQGYTTALSSTLRFKIGKESERNTYKMSLPGRFFLQRFLRRAVDAGCSHAVIEVTSEAVKGFRHKFVSFDALLFTNIAPEHIESHGSFEKYLSAKLEIARTVSDSEKRPRVLVSNLDDEHGTLFIDFPAEKRIGYKLVDATEYDIKKRGLSFTYKGIPFTSPLSGIFNLSNILGALSVSEVFGVTLPAAQKAISKFSGIPGRMEFIEEGQDFTVIVDYAHTPDSLEKVYEAFQGSRRICVLGGTGGGRDTWKRPLMGEIAARHCDHIILTNEDPYDEDPLSIIEDVRRGVGSRGHEIILDRRLAIEKGISLARTGDAVLITGKGTDPYIMGPNGTKQVWSDSEVSRESIHKKNI